MKRLALTFWNLLAGTFLLLIGIGLLGTLVPLRLNDAGASSLMIGVVGGAYFVGLIVGTRHCDRIIGTVGHIRAFAGFASILSAATLAFPLLASPLPWAGLRFITGVCLAGLFTCVESWLNVRASNELRGRILSLYMIALYLGQGVGQMLLPLPDPSGMVLFMLCAAFVSLSVAPVAMTRISAPPPGAWARLGLRRLYALSPLGAAGAVSSGLILGAFYALGPLYARHLGFGVGETAQFMSLVIVGGLILQWPVGRLSDRYDRRRALVGVAFALVVVSGALVAAGMWSGRAALLLAPLLGAAAFTLYPLSVAHANDRLEPAQIVAASAALITAYGVGAAFGPPAAAVLMETIGPSGLFTFTGVCAGATAIFAVWRMRRRGPVPAEEQVRFLPLPRTTPVAGGLDPRADAPPLPERGEATTAP
ncbi:MAG: MFS transporter [Rhodospirillales bacterium]|jgi:MFS family permease|nr:MFS transporter [Rhodospirillales bacterium]